jgi:uncharacterized protein YbbC (DUF1343 family)
MSKSVKTGLNRLKNDKNLQNSFKGNVAYLCHSASINEKFQHGLEDMIEIFGNRLIKIFGPQHGFVTDVQDNMVESNHYVHPYFKRPVYSLYSETRIPTDEMLEGIDHFFVDLQDVGCRIYTYIYTLTHLLEKCANKNIQVIVLDRPNPINCIDIEGNILDTKFASFVGRHPMPVRHAMTIGEVGLMHQKYWANTKANYQVIAMENYTRNMSYEDTGLPWVLPSPNLATIDAAYTFNASVMYEGTNISEGRGTTRALEIIGHPKLEAFGFYHDHLKYVIKENNLEGFELRPLVFQPTFQKHAGTPCGGYQIHVTDRKLFKPWRVGQMLMRELYHHLGADFKWKQPPYEYVHDQMPIDVINGTDQVRLWIEKNGHLNELIKMESEITNFKQSLENVKLYH